MALRSEMEPNPIGLRGSDSFMILDSCSNDGGLETDIAGCCTAHDVKTCPIFTDFESRWMRLRLEIPAAPCYCILKISLLSYVAIGSRQVGAGLPNPLTELGFLPPAMSPSQDRL